MDCMPVFRMLQEIFPQVDVRLLKAVAIEHSPDLSSAVEFIISDVLPSLRGPTKSSFSLHAPLKQKEFSMDCEASMRNVPLPHQEEPEEGRLSTGSFEAYGATLCDDHATNSHIRRPCARLSSDKDSLAGPSEIYEATSQLNLDGVDQETNSYSKPMSPASDVDYTAGASLKSDLLKEIIDTSVTSICYHLVPTEEPGIEESSKEHVNAEEHTSEANFTESDINDSRQGLSYPIVERNPDCRSNSEEAVRSLSHIETEHLVSATSTSAYNVSWPTPADSFHVMESETLVAKDLDIRASEQEMQILPDLRDSELMTFEPDGIPVAENNESAMASSCSSQVGIDFLEQLISNSKSKKNMLVSALESVSSQAKEVQFHEESAKQAKEDASKAGEDVLTKTEDLKQRVKQAKEANDMYAGEVYGEKAILATEARELQSRLVKLSDKQDNYFSMVDEIRQTLDARLAAAKEDQAAAEQKKLEKEELARKLFHDQELIMDEIVQDSERLQDQAKENSKLLNFMVDRGRVLDVLQGEIAVICEDILSLKERVEGRIPLSRSYSRTTRSAASSLCSSHHRSVSSEEATTSICSSESPKTSTEPPRSPQPASLAGIESSDDDWELCEKGARAI